jgi:hypothetical protein
MREYVGTAAEVAGRPVTYEQFRDALVGAVDDAEGALEDRSLADVEQAALEKTTTGVTTDDLLAALRKAVDNAKEARA